MRIQLPARYYLITLFLLASFLMALLGQFLYSKGDQIQQEVQLNAEQQAQLELSSALEKIMDLLNTELNTLVNWDEVHLQFSQPSYYHYWHSQRMKQSEFYKPYYLELELYDAQRQKLVVANNETYQVLPKQLAKHDKYLQVQPPRKELLVLSKPVFKRSNPSQINGYVSIAIDFFKLLETEAKFNYLDFERLFFNRSGIISEQDILQSLEYQSIAMPVNSKLWQLIGQFVVSFVVAAIVIGVLMSLATGLMFIWPLHSLSSHLNMLANTKTLLDSKPKYLISELNKLHQQLTDYHNQLLTSQSKLVEKNQLLHNLVRQDSLTGLANLRALDEFWQIISLEINEHPFEISYLIFDCDQFGFYNKNYNHQIGDQIIIEAGNILQNIFSNTSVYRVGIDQFVVILTNTNPKQVEQLGTRALQQIYSYPFERLGVYEKVSFSLGISHMQATDAQNHLELLPKQARIAVFKAKQQLSNKTYIYQAPSSQNLRSVSQQTLNKVIDSVFNPELLNLYFQPIVDCEQKILYYETLVRIDDGAQIILPETICTLVKQHGLEEEFDQTVLKKLLKILPTLDLSNLQGISFNLAANTLLQPYLIDLLEPFLPYLKQVNLVIEVKESIVTQHPDLFTLNLNKLRRQGFLIAIDQFAQENTNLLNLPKLPVDCIKLDKKILQLLTSGEINQKFVSNILTLLLNAPAYTVVVGIETQHQFEQLLALVPADFHSKLRLQGYFFGRPQPYFISQTRKD